MMPNKKDDDESMMPNHEDNDDSGANDQQQRRRKKKQLLTPKDLIDILEAKDSKIQPSGRVVCFTTNKFDALPGILVNFFGRQGKSFKFRNAGTAVMREYWDKFYLSNDNRSTTFEDFLVNYNLEYRPNGTNDDDGNEIRLDRHSPSAMQSYCMQYRDHPEEACKKENVVNFLSYEQSSKQNNNQPKTQRRKHKLKLTTKVFQETAKIESDITLGTDDARKLMDDPRNMVGQQRNKAKALDAAQRESRDQKALIRLTPYTMNSLKFVTTLGLCILLILAGEITRRHAELLARGLQSINTALSLGFRGIDAKAIKQRHSQLNNVVFGVPLFVLSLLAWEWWRRRRWSTYRCQSNAGMKDVHGQNMMPEIAKALTKLFNTRLGPETSDFMAGKNIDMHGKLTPSQKDAIPLSSVGSGKIPSSPCLKIDMSPRSQGQKFNLLTPICDPGVMHYHEFEFFFDGKKESISIGWSLTNETNIIIQNRKDNYGNKVENLETFQTQYIDIFLPRSMLFPRDDYRDRHKKIMESMLSEAFLMHAKEEDGNQD